jgi:molecular chaperone GrpE
MDEQKPETAKTADKSNAPTNGTKDAASPDNGNTTTNAETAAPISLEQQVADAKAEAAKNLDGWQRMAAEFANYRKRTDKERAETYQLATVETIKKLVPVIDDFDRAIQSIPADQASGPAYEGLMIIHRKLIALLEPAGIKVVNPTDEAFNAAYHEAIGQDDGTGRPSGQVTTVLQKGYLYGDKVLRAALVRVAS